MQPHVAYLLKSAACLAIIRFIQETNQGFINEMWTVSYQARSICEQFHQIRQLHEIQGIQNKISFLETAHDDLGVGPQAQVRIAPFLPQFPKSRVWTG